MYIQAVKLTFKAEWVSSLKEKRMIVKGLISKASNKFNIAVAEVENQDIHTLITIGFCCISNSAVLCNSICDKVTDFLENNTDALLIDTIREDDRLCESEF